MTKWAFLVGISNYNDDCFNDLEFSDNYTSDFKQILMESGEFEEVTIIRLNNENLDKIHTWYNIRNLTCLYHAHD